MTLIHGVNAMIYGLIFFVHCCQTKLDGWIPGLSKKLVGLLYLTLALTSTWPIVGIPVHAMECLDYSVLTDILAHPPFTSEIYEVKGPLMASRSIELDLISCMKSVVRGSLDVDDLAIAQH